MALARHCCFLAPWRGASRRVLSAHWLSSVVHSSSGQSITVRAECLFVLRRKYVLWDGTPSRHKIWLAGRHCRTVCHARLCYQKFFDDTCVKRIHVLCLSISVVSLDPLGLLWINLLTQPAEVAGLHHFSQSCNVRFNGFASILVSTEEHVEFVGFVNLSQAELLKLLQDHLDILSLVRVVVERQAFVDV